MPDYFDPYFPEFTSFSDSGSQYDLSLPNSFQNRIVTEDSDTIAFDGSGSLNSPLTAHYIGTGSGGGTFDSGSFVTTSSFNNFSSSYSQDSASFNSRIVAATGSVFNSGSLLLTSSFQAYTASSNLVQANIYASQSNYVPTIATQSLASINTFSQSIQLQVNNVYASESNYTPTSSFNALSSSYSVDSASLLIKISASTYNPAQLNLFSQSIQSQVTNVFASESNYTPTSSFNNFSSSYVTDSSSLLSKINAATYNPAQLNLFTSSMSLTSLNTFTSSISLTSLNSFTGSIQSQVTNVFASQSNYTLTSSFAGLQSNVNAFTSSISLTSLNTFTSSISVASLNTFTGSIQTQVNNVFASESNYTTTSSFNTVSSSISTQLNSLQSFSSPRILSSGSFIGSTGSFGIDFSTFYLTYNVLELYLFGLRPVTDNTSIYLYLSSDGTSFDSASANYKWEAAAGVSSSPTTAFGRGSGSDFGIAICPNAGNAANKVVNAKLTFYNCGSSGSNPVIGYDAQYLNNTGDFVVIKGGGVRQNNQVTKGIQFKGAGNSNISSSFWKLEGHN